MKAALKKDNVLQIVRPQTSGEQEAEATQQLAETLKKISDEFRQNLKSLIHTYRIRRMEHTNLSMRLFFLKGRMEADKKALQQMHRLYKQAQTDFVVVQKEAAKRKERLKNQ